MNDYQVDFNLEDIDDIEIILDVQCVGDIQRQKRCIKDFLNSFEFFNDKEIKHRFRIFEFQQ